MLEKIKNLGNLPLVVILIVVVIIAIVLSIFKAQTAEESNADTYVSNSTQKEEIEDEESVPEVSEQEVIENVPIDVEVPEEEVQEDQNIDAKYFIRVNYGQNVVTIYTKDSNGEYTVPYKAMVCSTGTATPRSGTYTIPGSGTKWPRGVWGMMIGNVWAQYFTRIKGSILFHSVPYTEQNKWSLEYWEYDKLGTTASAGCIRLTVEDAKWIYNNCPAGTKVEFYTDSNPGPLGKPTAQKISEEEAVRGWDPTDPDAGNPWKTYNPSQEQEETEKDQDTTNKTPKPNKPSTPTTPTKPEQKPEEKPDQNLEQPEKPKDEPTIPEEGESSGQEQEGSGSAEEGNGEEGTNPDKEGSAGESPDQEKPNEGDGDLEDNSGKDNEKEEAQNPPSEDNGTSDEIITTEPNQETEA